MAASASANSPSPNQQPRPPARPRIYLQDPTRSFQNTLSLHHFPLRLPPPPAGPPAGPRSAHPRQHCGDHSPFKPGASPWRKARQAASRLLRGQREPPRRAAIQKRTLLAAPGAPAPVPGSAARNWPRVRGARREALSYLLGRAVAFGAAAAAGGGMGGLEVSRCAPSPNSLLRRLLRSWERSHRETRRGRRAEAVPPRPVAAARKSRGRD